MPFLNIPIKSIQAEVTSVVGTQTMQWYDPQDFPVQPPNPMPPSMPNDFRWRVVMSITPQLHSSYITRAPGVYNGQDVAVGQWIANTTTGQAWQIISIEAKDVDSITAIVQDIFRYNTYRDPSQVGNGAPITGMYVIFNVGDNGFPQIDPVPSAGVSANFSENLQSRFEYINLQYDYPLYQQNNTFKVGDIIAVDASTNSFVLSNNIYRTAIGRVTSISDTIAGWFTVNPVQKVVDYLDYLPGGIGDVIYTSLITPGTVTTTPGGSQLYIKLRNNTQSISYSTLPGPTAPGNVFQLNGVDVTVYTPGDKNAVVAATNSKSAQTGVSASIVLAPTTVETNSALVSTYYGGEVLLYAAASPAVATINGVTVTFNITSTDVGYTSYARPAQIVQAINNAAIPNIVATTTSNNSVKITNTAGGAITIVNVTNDVNNVPVAGSNSATGLVLSTAASVATQIKFIAVDARAINFLDVIGTPTEDFGLISVENGVKAAGLYIEEGIRQSICTVVTDLVAMYALKPLPGDQAYVLNSVDAQGNNTNQWSLWLYDGTAWVKTSTQSSSQTAAKSLEYNLLHNSPSSITLGALTTARRVTLITVQVTTPFSAGATLNIGYIVNNPFTPVTNTTGLMDNSIIDLSVAGTYTTQTDIFFGTDTPQGDVTITAAYVASGSLVGNAQIIISYV